MTGVDSSGRPEATKLILIRHAQPRGDNSAAGADPELTPEGSAQADALARWMAGRRGSQNLVLWSSPMRRAQETARPIADKCGVEINTDDRLAEFDFGASAYVPIEQLDRAAFDDGVAALATGRWGSHSFDPDAFEARVQDVMRDLIAHNRGKTLAVVCHGGVINSYLCVILKRPRGFFFQPRYTSISHLVVRRNSTRPFLLSLNEVPHLAS